MLHLEHSFVWCGNLDSLETRSVVPGKFWNVVLEKISWTECVSNEAVLHRVKEERNILHTVRQRKANWIGHMLHRNCHLRHIIKGKIRGTKRWGRRCKPLLDDLRKQEDTGSWRRKLRFTRFGELGLEEAMDLSQDRLLLDLNLNNFYDTPILSMSWLSKMLLCH
jgi:hypothetical protein